MEVRPARESGGDHPFTSAGGRGRGLSSPGLATIVHHAMHRSWLRRHHGHLLELKWRQLHLIRGMRAIRPQGHADGFLRSPSTHRSTHARC